MKQYQQTIIITILFILLAAYMGRSYIRGLFPPKMEFESVALTNIETNQQTNINNFKGKVVIVSCYQSWCSDCARETPLLNQLATNIKSDNFAVIYISDESIDKATGFRQRFSSDKIIFTQSSISLSSMGINVFPTTYLLDKKGQVVQTKLEGHDWLKEEEAIKKLLAE